MGQILKLTLTLTLIAALAGFAITSVFEKTKEPIKDQEALAINNALQEIFPKGTTTTFDSLTEVGSFWVGKNDTNLIGYAFQSETEYAYSSKIKFIIALEPDGTILGLNILSQGETPGLGSRVQEVVSKAYFWTGLFAQKEKSAPWFTKQFGNLETSELVTLHKTAEWHTLETPEKETLVTNNSITAITGATISTNAVIKGVQRVYKEKLLTLKEHYAL